MYVRGVRNHAHRYFSLLGISFPYIFVSFHPQCALYTHTIPVSFLFSPSMTLPDLFFLFVCTYILVRFLCPTSHVIMADVDNVLLGIRAAPCVVCATASVFCVLIPFFSTRSFCSLVFPVRHTSCVFFLTKPKTGATQDEKGAAHIIAGELHQLLHDGAEI
jgi:hypothetical protein